MQIEKISHCLTIIGNAGLLLGVTLVIFQINQNSELVREQLFHSSWTDDLNLQLAMMGDNPAAAVARAVESPAELTVEDARVLHAYLSYWALSKVREIHLFERGMAVFPPSTYASDDPAIPLHRRLLGNAYYKATFEETGLGPELGPRLQGFMDSLSGNEALEEYERIIKRIKESQ